LAASGILVVQIGNGNDDCTGTPEEGSCGLAMLEGAANQLVSQGLADPERIGAIGFSRTGFQVMEELTTGSLHLRAASVTDSVMFTYLQFLSWPERFGPGFSTVLGAPPVGEGLQQWLKRSPGFNLDKVRTPLLVNAEGTNDVLFMWEPYAGLRYMHKPVDLIVLNTDEHVLTNPAVRMASQGGSVDWFRFWLQGYEDPDPAKAEHYKRWRELRKLQEENGKNSASSSASASL
jgi:dipeptidyl aminopeptidase/acylaminoacyl peptidase